MAESKASELMLQSSITPMLIRGDRSKGGIMGTMMANAADLANTVFLPACRISRWSTYRRDPSANVTSNSHEAGAADAPGESRGRWRSAEIRASRGYGSLSGSSSVPSIFISSTCVWSPGRCGIPTIHTTGQREILLFLLPVFAS
jgi:hypothetical protein